MKFRPVLFESHLKTIVKLYRTKSSRRLHPIEKKKKPAIVPLCIRRAKDADVSNSPELDDNKRNVFLDGVNVLENYSSSLNARALYIVLNKFERQGFRVRIFLPVSIANEPQMSDLLAARKLVPLEGNEYAVERQIMELTDREDAVLLSNNNYSSHFYNFQKVVNGRIIGYCWFYDSLYVVSDPYGRRGPMLNQILYKTAS